MRIGVDVGGTFTDIVVSYDGGLYTTKTPTTEDQSVGVVKGVEKACDELGEEPSDAEGIVHATTVGVNALLERDGAETALVTTKGFSDIIEIGRQTRDELYDLGAEKAESLVPRERRYEVDERTTVDGVEKRPDKDELDAVSSEVDAESVAVCLLHSYTDPSNERVVSEELEAPHVSLSSDVLREFREYERFSTTVVDAYVTPTVAEYIERLVGRLNGIGAPEPLVMQSNGGVARPERVSGGAVRTVMSGPSAGVVGASGFGYRVVSFDMGGTSTDVGVVRGSVERTRETRIEGLHIGVPSVDVTTVGAGGGSIAYVDEGGALRVGPESAGAEPGPACYGLGGERPTLTDADVALGYVQDGKEFGDEIIVDADKARDALSSLNGFGNAEEAAIGVRKVATETTARTVRSVTVERGYDPRRFTLVAFGGAGPAHAVDVADSLSLERVVVPRAGGVLSAYGLLCADERAEASQTVGEGSDEEREEVLESLEDEVRNELEAEGLDDFETHRLADMRYKGQGDELTVSVGTPFDSDEAHDRFEEEHKTRYGYTMDVDVRTVSLRAVGVVGNESPEFSGGDSDASAEYRSAVFKRGEFETAFYDGFPEGELETPAVVEADETTAVVPPGWNATGGDRLEITKDGGRR